MSESTVKREKLVNPITLVLIGVAFAIAFVLLLPGAQTFVFQRQGAEGPSDDSSSAVDDLELAYLKARSAAGEFEADEFQSAIDSLIENHQFDKLDEFLAENPDIDLSMVQKFRMELESAVVAFQATGGLAGDNVETIQLANTLSIIQTEPSLQDKPTLIRAIELSKPLGRHDMIGEFYALVTSPGIKGVTSDEKFGIFHDCGQHFASVALHRESIACLSEALDISADDNKAFDVKIALLEQVGVLGNPVDIEEVVSAILLHRSMTNSQKRNAATALLAVGRPDAAHPLYASLAETETAKSAFWYSEAANWAAASSDPHAAAIYTEKMIAADPGSKTVAVQTQLQEYWIAAGKNEKALEQIYLRLDKNNADLKTLQQGVALARQLNLVSQAKIWNEQILEIDRDDIEAIKLQADLSLGARDIESAFKWANVAVVIEPDNIDSRRKLAQVSEWSGRPDEAEQHWQWVARKSPDAESAANVVRLAEMNFRHDSAAEAAMQLAMLQKPDAAAINKIVDFYELNGEPSKAAKALRKIIEKHGRSAFILTRLGELHDRHAQYTEALTVWEEFEEHYGSTTDSSLALTELHWRLDNPKKAAEYAVAIKSTQALGEASEYQIRLLSELSWRYREPALGRMVEPLLVKLEESGQRDFYRRRVLDEYAASGNYETAFEMANQDWRESGDVSEGLKAMELASKMQDPANFNVFLASVRDMATLRQEPRYWSLVASHHLKNGEKDRANLAYTKMLELNPSDVSAISGLLWLHIGDGQLDRLEALLAKYDRRAETEPALWSAYAVAHLQLGNATESVRWFERQIDTMDADYSLLLTFSDALEAAGRAEHAYRVRRFAVGKLRPLIASATREARLGMARQYASLVTRFGGVEQAEDWTRYLLAAESETAPAQTPEGAEKYWREDVALAWLMATQRHEHARVIMARIHEERVRKPVWQALSMALNDDDHDALGAVLASAENISVGNRILAMGVLGQEREAMHLARKSIRTGPTLSDRSIAAQQYVYLRGLRPSYTHAGTRTMDSGALNVNETRLTLRHSFSASDLGIGLDVAHSDLGSDEYNLAGRDSRDSVALSLYFGNSQAGGRLTTGFVGGDDTDTTYATGRYFRRSKDGAKQLAAEFGFNEPATQSPALRVAALQNRAGIEYESSFGTREYYRLSASASELFTRVQEANIAQGLQARGELGMRGTMGSNSWSSSVSLSTSQFDVEDSMPSELFLTPTTTIGSVIASESTSLALGGSLSRGGIAGEYPQTTSPRYFLNGTVAHAWPDKSFGVQFEGGIGMRVLGGDELSFSFAHDGLAKTLASGVANSTSLGMNYRYHFKR